jgi:hypothetical protein
LRVVEEQRIESRGTGLVLLVDGRVEVVEQLVADGHCVAGGLGDERPAVGFLGGGADFGVVAVKGVGEGAEGEPSGRRVVRAWCDGNGWLLVHLPGAESLGDVSSEATDIRTDDGDLVETGHLEDL